MYILKRNIPARTETLQAKWCKLDFCKMGPDWRKGRARTSDPLDTCFLCKKKFSDGETMALACFIRQGNKVLCQACGQKLINGKIEE